MSSSDIIITWQNINKVNCERLFKNTQYEDYPIIRVGNSLDIEQEDINSCSTVRGYYGKSNYEGHDEKAIKLAQEFIYSEELNFLNYKSYNLLFIVEFWLTNFFGRALQFSADFKKIQSNYPAAEWQIINTGQKSNNWIEEACEELPYFILKEFSKECHLDFNRTEVEVNEANLPSSEDSFNIKKKLKEISFIRKLYDIYKNMYHSFINDIIYKNDEKILLIDKWKNVKEIFKDGNEFIPIRPIYKDRMSKDGRIRLKEIESHWKQNKKIIKGKLSSTDDFYGLTDAIIYMLDSFITTEAPKIIKWIDSLESQVQKKKVRLIFLRIDSRDHYRVGAMVGKRHDTPSLVLQHGIIGHPDTGYGFSPICVDKCLVFGKYDKNILKALGEEENKIQEVGNPKLERTYNLTSQQGSRKVEDFDGSLNILFTTATVRTRIRRTFGNTHLTSRDIYKQFEMIRGTLDDLNLLGNLIIKLHPGDHKSNYHISLAHRIFGKDCNIMKDGNIVQLISEADVLVTVASTTALEAMASGTPVIIIGDDIEKNYYRQMIKEGVVLYAKNSNELKKNLTYLQEGENWEKQSERAKKYLKKNYALDGNAIERIRNLMIEMVSDNK